MKTLWTWIAIGVVEILLSLFLFAIAPIFLNSNQPTIGFLIWLAVPTLLSASGLYVGLRIAEALRARHLFITRFPQYRPLGVLPFLDLSVRQVVARLELLDSLRDDPDWQALQISPLDFLRQPNSRR